MIRNYFTIAWRNLIKNKVFSSINILGLATGLGCFILIALFITDELGYDRFHVNADRIYRINADIKFGGNEAKMTVTPDPMGAALKKDYPQVEEYVRIYASGGSKLIKKGSQNINEDKVCHADSTFFNVFTFPALSGDTKTALSEPNTVVITASTAKKYFNTTEVLDKTILADNQPYKVTAVIEDMPKQSHFNFDFIFSMKNVDYQMGNFLSNNFHTYILLKKGVDYKAFNNNFAQVIDKYILPQAKQIMQINSIDDFKKAGNYINYMLMPILDIHLKSDRFPELGTNGSMQYVYIFSAVALFILALACINFMNLSTARSSNRAKEVGIRKVLGTTRGSLIRQFLSESVLMVTIALIIAIGFCALVLPFFNNLTSKSLSLLQLLSAKHIIILLLLPLVVGILAGSYPAFFLSRFKPISVLKSNQSGQFKKSSLRSFLVVFQFATSIVLIIGTIVVYRQLNYIQNKKLGFSKEQVLLVSGVNALKGNATAFKNEVLTIPGVVSGTLTGYLPVSFSARSDNTYSKESVMDSKNSLNMQNWTIDYDYLSTMGMEIIKGRNFSKDFGSDSTGMIINETTARILGYEDPIGKKLYSIEDVPTDGSKVNMVSYEIIGVVKNFHFESLRENIAPLCFQLKPGRGWLAAFKVNPVGNIKNLINQVEQKWKAVSPDMEFSYRFLDEAFDNMYRSEQRMGKAALAFSLLAIWIACLGLFGLATYMAEQRIKEIGIRKVMGASVANITAMLSKDFLKLVLIAALIAFPIAWYIMYQWLQDFAYRTAISWWIFMIAGIAAVVIAIGTVSFQAIKAALSNPVKSLRNE